jgi:hypothetical protein
MNDDTNPRKTDIKVGTIHYWKSHMEGRYEWALKTFKIPHVNHSTSSQNFWGKSVNYAILALQLNSFRWWIHATKFNLLWNELSCWTSSFSQESYQISVLENYYQHEKFMCLWWVTNFDMVWIFRWQKLWAVITGIIMILHSTGIRFSL